MTIAVLISLVWCETAVAEQTHEVRVGILAHMGKDRCRESWQPSMDYLTSHISGYKFTLVPLAFEEINNTVNTGVVDFIIANSSIYAELEALYNVSRIATMEKIRLGKGYTVFGGVIFTRAVRSDINKIEDLRGKTFAAVDKTSLGGFRAAWGQMRRHGIDPFKDLNSVVFEGKHQKVVEAVGKGRADAGTVRTDTLETMAANGEITLKDFKVIKYEGKGDESFPFLLSTPLYPEWPIAKVRHTPDSVAKLVASALLAMPMDSPAAKAADIVGWTIPLNYEPVDALLKFLQVSPYENYGRVTWRDILRQHSAAVIFTLLFISALIILLIFISRLSMRLNESRQSLALSFEQVEAANNQIMDSIRYASSIQRAILPQLHSLTSHLEDYFVIWQPRDVIGGDLYWFFCHHNDIMIAVIDCTGHGVPGAIMTMLAGTTLNRVVNELGYGDPSLVLTNMNKMIRDTLSSDENNSFYDNGLDIGICYVNKKLKTLVFAGARISLYFSEGHSAFEVKGDRQSVGYQTSNPDFIFTNHKINITNEMKFYMMTDGLSDQVGGHTGVPFGKKRFMEFITANNAKSFQTQQNMLHEMFHQYRAEESQRDDITVIGFKI